MEQLTGFEPVPQLWKSHMLAVKHQSRIFGQIQTSTVYRDLNFELLQGIETHSQQEKGSNLRPQGYEPRELPLLYPAICCKSQELNLIKSAYETDEIPYLPTAVYYLLRSRRVSNPHFRAVTVQFPYQWGSRDQNYSSVPSRQIQKWIKISLNRFKSSVEIWRIELQFMICKTIVIAVILYPHYLFSSPISILPGLNLL